MPSIVTDLWAYLPGLLVLLFLSGFFSGSEAAFFSLTPSGRRTLAGGRRTERLAHRLLGQSEKLLMAILFWNLAINIAYFSLVSKVALELRAASTNDSVAVFVTLGALLVIIVLGEFLPKSVAVTYPLPVVRAVVLPLAFTLRLTEPILPVIKLINEASRRLVWPGFKPEPYLALADLDRAVELSTYDAQLYKQESQVLRNVIRLSEIRVEEWMRPRTQFRSFTPPISLEQLGGQQTPSGYMLVTDSRGVDVISVVHLASLRGDQSPDLSRLQQPLIVVPWCATIADALERLRENQRRVAVIVNEFGETIGILTLEEIMEAILHIDEAQSQRELARADLRLESEGVWVATGLTKLRRLERVLGRPLATGRGLTIGGVIQEQLRRLPESGDACEFDGLQLHVIEAGQRGEILVRVTDSCEDPEDVP